MSRAALIQTAFLGDAVLTTPLAELLARQHGPIDVVTTPAAKPIFETLQTVRDVVVFDKYGTDRGYAGIRRMARILAARKLGYVYLPHKSFRSALIARLSGAKIRVGFDDTLARWLYTDRVEARGDHEIQRLCCLARHGDDVPQPRLGITDSDRTASYHALQQAGISAEFAVVAPGSHQATKRWPYYPALIERLTKLVDVVLIGDARDQPTGAQVVPAKYRFANLAGHLSLRASAEVIRRAAIVVCNDSVALHIASSMGTPIVAVFGPTDPMFGFGPRGDRDITVGVGHLPCRPCSTHGGSRCPLRHHRCMIDLHLDTVTEAVLKLLNETEASSTCV